MSYCVAYINRETNAIESVLSRGMDYGAADSFCAQYVMRAREGMYFSTLNEHDARLLVFDGVVGSSAELRKLEDEQWKAGDLQGFVAGVLVMNPDIRPTPLLRLIRDTGRACGWNRVKQLMQAVQADEDPGS